MSELPTEVPRARWNEAVELLVSALPEEVRQPQRATIVATLAADPAAAAGLLGIYRNLTLSCVGWLQPQPGRTAHLWPPVQAAKQQSADASSLVAKALEVARRHGAVLVQSLLSTDTGEDAKTLCRVGFRHIADLLYLVSLPDRFPASAPSTGLSLTAISDVNDERLKQVVEQTYEGSRDCPALDRVRSIDDVLAGYRAAGRFRPELWLVARAEDQDAGCLLLADHAPEPVWELVYLGVVARLRGRGIGIELTRYAQWLAARENIERLVLAVDAANQPAIDMYAAAGFTTWDRRSVFVYLTD